LQKEVALVFTISNFCGDKMRTRNGPGVFWGMYLRYACLLLVIVGNLLTPLGGTAVARGISQPTSADFPTVDPLYIYHQLTYLTSHFQRREAGYVAGQGHDRFALYWSQEMAQNLEGFNPQVRQDDFFIQGWQGQSASLPAFNMEISIPGLLYPEQEVIIGCHYDGEANSVESAFDDTSGCAYELGVGEAMGNYWRSHHLYPARTIRFVIFDAEEQGVFGSFHYLNSTINGDLGNVTAMFNEEQSGINYPARYLGQLANPFMPDYIDVTPLQDNAAYPGRIHLTATQRQNVIRFRQLWSQAIPAVFAQMRAEGYSSLDFYNNQKQNSVQPIFSPEQETSIHIQDDPSSNSDHVPFIYAGLPVVTLTGDQTYYDPHPPQWAYPYDQPEDSLALMNTYTDGSSRMSPPLALALALPAMFTTWMLNQSAIGGSVPTDGSPLAAISDIGQTVAGQPLMLDAEAAFDPSSTGAGLSYAWNFGDGATAIGPTVKHIYQSTGVYTLTLTVSASSARRVVRKTLYVGSVPNVYSNPYSPLSGHNVPNPAVKIPTSDAGLPAQPPLAAPFVQLVTPTPTVSLASPTTATTVVAQPHSQDVQPASQSILPFMIVLILIILGIVLLGVWLLVLRQRSG
jgi:hypothetical protein